MIVFIKGVVKTVDNKSFKNKEGELVEYKEVYFQTTDEGGFQETSKLTTKKDLLPYVDEIITLKVGARQDGKLWKLSILEVVPE